MGLGDTANTFVQMNNAKNILEVLVELYAWLNDENVSNRSAPSDGTISKPSTEPLIRTLQFMTFPRDLSVLSKLESNLVVSGNEARKTWRLN